MSRIQYMIKHELRGTTIQIYGMLAMYSSHILEQLVTEFKQRPINFTQNATGAMESIMNHRGIT